MAMSAFKSTTKRSQIGETAAPKDSGSANRAGHHHRSRSLSRFSGRFAPPESEIIPHTRGKFVNTVRGSGFPEISLDDLATKFFFENTGFSRGRSDFLTSEVGTPSSIERSGRSISRHHEQDDGNNISSSNIARRKGFSDSASRRRRSFSVARYQCSDSESDMDYSHSSSQCLKSSQKTSSNDKQVLRRSLSQKNLSSHDGYSSHSSTLTDDEPRDIQCVKKGMEKTIRTVFSQEKMDHPAGDGMETGLYDAMCKEIRHCVQEMKTELQLVMSDTQSLEDLHYCLPSAGADPNSDVRKTWTKELEESEKRKKELLAELAFEEQRYKELSIILRELPLDHKQIAMQEKPTHIRKRSNDENRMSNQLFEEAEQYFEEFLSNVEDTDFSSFDGEQSDASSTVKRNMQQKEPFVGCTTIEANISDKTDGIVLPWLQWETSNDVAVRSSEKLGLVENIMVSPIQDSSVRYSDTSRFISSCDSSDIGEVSCPSITSKEQSLLDDLGILFPLPHASKGKVATSFDMDDYHHLEQNEELLFERFRQRHKINSSSLFLCGDRNCIY